MSKHRDVVVSIVNAITLITEPASGEQQPFTHKSSDGGSKDESRR